ncbi:unnamed protein product [Prunus brigantina]
MLSAKEQIACEDHLLDPFVENFILEIKVHSGFSCSCGWSDGKDYMTGERKSFHQVALTI